MSQSATPGTTEGKRFPDTRLGNIPVDVTPGGYWKVLSRKTGEPMNVITNSEDRHYWSLSAEDDRWSGNLTGGVWGYISPNGLYGIMSIHTVREEDDGTISVRPGDGSSNSILIEGSAGEVYHGYIEHGVWSEV